MAEEKKEITCGDELFGCQKQAFQFKINLKHKKSGNYKNREEMQEVLLQI